MDMIMLWIDILLPVLTILIPVFTTIYTVTNRIKNENREEHKPYIILDSIKDVDSLDTHKYFLTAVGRNYKEEYENNSEKIDDNQICLNLVLKNIGYGVASNIKFYDLLTGVEIHGTQDSIKDKNQKLFTTFDIAKDEIKNVQMKVISLLKEEDGIIKEDHNRILCVYEDLNNNVYSTIITINMKEKSHYDFFAYQPTSRSYKRWIKENRKEYKKIYKEYKSL